MLTPAHVSAKPLRCASRRTARHRGTGIEYAPVGGVDPRDRLTRPRLGARHALLEAPHGEMASDKSRHANVLPLSRASQASAPAAMLALIRPPAGLRAANARPVRLDPRRPRTYEVY
jgi:hypothetical protein